MLPVFGLILAGGEAARFGGGDKCLQLFQGRPLLAHIQEKLAAQTNAHALSANGDPTRFAAFGMPVLPDLDAHHETGPLAGLISGLTHARDQGYELLLTVPGDAPLFPASLARDLYNVLQANDCACAESGGHAHPVFSLWRTSCLPGVLDAAANRTRALWKVQERLSTIMVSYETIPCDPFMDADTPGELAELERTAASLGDP